MEWGDYFEDAGSRRQELRETRRQKINLVWIQIARHNQLRVGEQKVNNVVTARRNHQDAVVGAESQELVIDARVFPADIVLKNEQTSENIHKGCEPTV